MQITTTQTYEVTVKAVLREGELKVSLTVGAAYANGERTATVTEEEFPEELVDAVRQALVDLRDAKLAETVRRASRAATQAEIYAAQMQEI